mmetsp:Transcript_6394/g.15972  ORF Transcript_6394/g.15972 Transcript_6394/m.15972 type:complete len:209 (+) Transcript_6394:115-741(+)
MGAHICCQEETSDDFVIIGNQQQQAGFSERIFQIVINKPRDKPLGLDVDITEPDVLRIIDIYPGPLAEWNKLNPRESIEPDDLIIKVNGVTGDSSTMLERCLDNTQLKLTLVRPSHVEIRTLPAASGASDAAAFVAVVSEELEDALSSGSGAQADQAVGGKDRSAADRRRQPLVAQRPPSPCICTANPIACMLPWLKLRPAIQAAAWS